MHPQFIIATIVSYCSWHWINGQINIYWIFESLFILSGPYLLRYAVSYDGTQTHTDHVQNVYWVLCLKESSLPKNDIFQKIPVCRPTYAQRWRVGRLAGWLQPRRPWPRPVLLIAWLLIAQTAYGAADWLAACRAVTATWQACRYLIDLSGKQLVRK